MLPAHREIVERLKGIISKVLTAKEIGELWARQGVAVVVTTPAESIQRYRDGFTKYEKLVKTASIKSG